MSVTYGFACTCCGTPLSANEDPGFDPEAHFAAYVEPAVRLTCPCCRKTSHTHWPINPGTVRIAHIQADGALTWSGAAHDYVMTRRNP